MTFKNKIFSLIIVLLNLLALTIFNQTFASDRNALIRKYFAKVNKSNRGPFGVNMWQTARKRKPIEGSFFTYRPKKVQFQAAFRKKHASVLAKNGFYVGNLFTTNYHLLYARHIVKDEGQTAFKMDHKTFFKRSQAASDAASMARHMLIEQFYVDRVPDTKLSKSFSRRGISGTEYETPYYYRFVKYLGSKLNNPDGYLLTYMIQDKWNLTGNQNNISLRHLRGRIDRLYKKCSGPKSKKNELFRIRNVIHSSMSIDVIKKINQFIVKYDDQSLTSIRDDIVLYYTINKTTMKEFSENSKRNIPQYFKLAIDELDISSIESIDQFSDKVIQLRQSYEQSVNPDLIHMILRSVGLIHKQAETFYRANKQDAIKIAPILIKAAYASGIISFSKLNQVIKLVNQSFNSTSLVTAIKEIPRHAHSNIHRVLEPGIKDWQLVFTEADVIVDDVLKSSTISLLDNIITTIKKSEMGNIDLIVQTPGLTYGYLRYIGEDDLLTNSTRYLSLDKKSIPVFEILPLFLAVTGGIITEEYQTELSHVKLKSDARGTPNLYYPNIYKIEPYATWIKEEKLVKMELNKNGQINISLATLSEAETFWKQNKPIQIGELLMDLSERRVRPTSIVSFDDFISVGSKASNYGELENVLGSEVVLTGLTVPFYYYHQFLEMNPDIKQEITNTIKDRQGRFYFDRVFRNDVLKSWRKKMRSKDSKINRDLVEKLQTWIHTQYPGKNMRFRSSTNTEDLINFNGAGLYNSTSYKPSRPKKTIERALKKVWASIWNLRAFDERELFGIDHLKVVMGILVSPGFPAQEGEGVAVTRNIIDPTKGKAVYFNVLAGEEHSVMNPSSGVTPDEFLVFYENNMKIDFLKVSNQSPNGLPVLNDNQITDLTELMLKAHDHFQLLYEKANYENFALDFEFKIDDEYDKNGEVRLQLKQVRPYLDQGV